MSQRSQSANVSVSTRRLPAAEVSSRDEVQGHVVIKARQKLEAEIALYRHALQKAREEFQAFAYSVSHDLRAPLRAIEGFSKILLEDFASDLGPEPQRFLKHIITNTQQISTQVEDLLRFYR